MQKYVIALYIRLSIEDYKYDSLSIENQSLVLHEYAAGITAATGTDNPTLVADIMRTMTTNVDVMKEIVTADNDFINNKPAMEEMAADESYGDAVLGGQNPLAMFCAGADKIDLSNMSIYDPGCNEEFQNAMKNYFEGNATYDEALDLFYKAVVEKYPELSY